MKSLIANITTVNNRRNSAAIGAGHFRKTNESRQLIIQVFGRYGHHFLGSIDAVDGCDHLKQITATLALQQCISVMTKNKRNLRMG
ncbi:hypothetical protein D3C81_1941290 [compost metagenome]